MTFKNTRDSNMELLRIIAMLLIMVIHASNRALPMPDSENIVANPTSTFLQFTARGFSIMGVDIFVMLSGWYGIRLRLSRLSELLFQILFFGILCLFAKYIVMNGQLPFSLSKTILTLFILDDSSYWFIKCYLGLCLFAPVLNAFVEHATKQQFVLTLYGLFSFQFIFGWVFEATTWIRAGYSLPFFMCLYLLARFMRVHQPKFVQLPRLTDLSIYLGSATILSVGVFLLRRYLGVGGVLYFYNSPIVILAATSLLLFFSKLSFHSQIINWLSISTLSIYLTHSSNFIGSYYDEYIRYWFSNETRTTFLVYTTLLIVIVFFCSILIDKIRLLLWRSIEKWYYLTTKQILFEQRTDT